MGYLGKPASATTGLGRRNRSDVNGTPISNGFETTRNNVGYSNVPVDNAWALDPSDPKGCYYLMSWRTGHPCGQGSGVRFSPAPDLPVLIDKPDHQSVQLLKELLAIVNSPTQDGKRKATNVAELLDSMYDRYVLNA